MTGEYLNNLVDVNDIECGKLNLIYAPCGSGKTTFAKGNLAKFAEEKYLCGFQLFLIDTAIGKDQFLQSGYVEENPWTNEPYWVVPGIGKVMTYAGYGKLMECAPKYDYVGIDGLVVCDELQNAIQWSKYPDDTLHQKAIETLTAHINAKDSTIVALSATPNAIRKEFAWCLNEVPLHGTPRHFEEKSVRKYRNLKQLLCQIPIGQRGIIYISHISQILKYKVILDQRGFKTGALWSAKNAEHPLDAEQIHIRDTILCLKRIPNDIDVLFINKSCETSITIGDIDDLSSHIDFMIIHSSEPDTQIQVRGRYRNDLSQLYLYDPNSESKVIVPADWLGRKLFKSDINELISELEIRDKKRSLVKAPTFLQMVKDSGYTVTSKVVRGIRYKIISK